MPISKWTVLTYIAAHNNLAQMGKQSLLQILNVGSTPEVVHGVLYDAQEGAGRYIMGDAGTVKEQEQFKSFDSGDPEALIDTARWLFRSHPAERYGVVLWSHGSGWEPSEVAAISAEARAEAPGEVDSPRERALSQRTPVLFRTTMRAMQQPTRRVERAILFDDGTGHSLDTLELARVIRTIAEAIGQPVDFLGMDACLMANLEVAHELQDSLLVLAASEELVPGHSWPYPVVYGQLQKQPEQDGRALAQAVVEHYVAFYSAHPPGAGDVTKVGLDLAKIRPLSTAVRGLAEGLLADMPRHAPILWEAQRATRALETEGETRRPNKFEFHLWDLGTIAARLAAAPESSPAVRAAASTVGTMLMPGRAIIEERHLGAWFEGIAGLSVYLMPPGQQRLSPSYERLTFATDTRWLEMLKAYHSQYA